MLGIPEVHTVKKTLLFLVGEYLLPVGPTVQGTIDAGLVSIANAQKKSMLVAKGVDIAELQGVGARYTAYVPCSAAARRFRIRAVCAAYPHGLVIDYTYSNEEGRAFYSLGRGGRREGGQALRWSLAGAVQQETQREQCQTNRMENG